MSILTGFLVAIAVAALLAGVVVLIVMSMKNRVVSGKEGMIDEVGITIDDFDLKGKGMIKVHGEIWKARSDDKILADDEVVVVGIEGLFLTVRKR